METISKVKLDRPLVALRNLALEMRKGNVVSVVGPSGCGKTTLLRIVAGLTPASEGEVIVGGKQPDEFCREGGIGFVFQKSVLFPWRTAIDNLLLATEIRNGKPREADRERAERLLDSLGLADFERAYPRELSGGMLQRVAIARALMIQPRLLLLDEPLSALDEITREQLWLDFSRIWAQRDLSVLLVTHSIREASFLGNRVLVMSRRPGCITTALSVPFGRPRQRALLANRDFVEFCEKVRDALS